MLNPLQKYCFELLEKYHFKDQNDFLNENYFQDIQHLFLGIKEIYDVKPRIKNDIQQKFEQHADLAKKNLDHENLKKFLKQLESQENSFFKRERFVGFRKTCVALYFTVCSSQSESGDPKALQQLRSAMRNFILSGHEKDLRKLVELVESPKYNEHPSYKVMSKNIDAYLSTYAAADRTLSSIVNNPVDCRIYSKEIKKNCKALLKDSDELMQNSPDKASKIMLTDVLQQTGRVLLNPYDESGITTCRQLTRKIPGHTVKWQRVIGVVLMITGAFAVLAGIVAAPSIVSVAAVPAGVTAMLCGWGLFAHGAKKDASLHANEIAREVANEVSKEKVNQLFADHPELATHMMYGW